MNTSVNRLQEFYLEAAAATYAGGVMKKETIPDLPRSKVYRYESGDLLYVDMFLMSGEYSGGQTVIYVESVPAWLMQYHGWCKDDNPEVLAFLKAALAAAYARREFHGGRGLPKFRGTKLLYTNSPQVPRHVRHEEDFAGFVGHEQIQLPDATVVFWHRYQGLLLATA